MSNLTELSARSLAAGIQARHFSPVEVVQAHIERIQAVNPQLNALVTERFEKALAEAHQAEQTLNPALALQGVPFSVKELIQVEGLPCTIGSIYRKQLRSNHTATAVQRLLAAGAILLGQTNLPEQSFWIESDNQVYGLTRNPYDLSRTPGGSSGGEGALIGAGGSPFGLGSDIAGSIRVPAFYCGIFGHKPSGGLIPITGQTPLELPERLKRPIRGAANYITIGPLTRQAEDLWPLLQLLSGPDGIDPTARPWALNSTPESIDWKNTTVYFIPEPRLKFCSQIQPEVANSVYQATQHLAQRGARLEELAADFFYPTVELWGACLADGGKKMVEVLGDSQGPINLPWESLKWLFKRTAHTPAGLLFCYLELFQFLNPRKIAKALKATSHLQYTLEQKLTDRHLLLLPPQPTVAPLHGELLHRPMDFGFTAIANILRLPATAIPLGLNSQGLPLGVQALAGRGLDHLTIGTALALEEAFGGWQPPTVRY